MNSGSAPLHVAAMIAGFGPGDEVVARHFHLHRHGLGAASAMSEPPRSSRISRKGPSIWIPGASRRRSRPGPRASWWHTYSASRRGWRRSWRSPAGTASSSSGIAPGAVGAHGQGTPVGLLRGLRHLQLLSDQESRGLRRGRGRAVAQDEKTHVRARHIRVHGSDRRYYHDIVGENCLDGWFPGRHSQRQIAPSGRLDGPPSRPSPAGTWRRSNWPTSSCRISPITGKAFPPIYPAPIPGATPCAST